MLLSACSQPGADSFELDLPAALSADFPDNDLAFSTIERSRLERATRAIFDAYDSDLAGHSEYELMLDADASLAAQAGPLQAALGERWRQDDAVPELRETQIVSFTRSDGNGGHDARIIVIAVPGQSEAGGAAARFQPARIVSSLPLANLE